MLQNATHAANRIQAGIDALADPQVLDAFRIANRTMAAAGRQRELLRQQGDASKCSRRSGILSSFLTS